MTTIQAGTSPPSVINDMGARLRRNGIDPDDVHRVDLLPLRFARIHELARDERGKHYAVNDGRGATVEIALPLRAGRHLMEGHR